MKPVSPPRRTPRTRLVLVLTLLLALFVLPGCGKSKDKKEPANKWDEMKWDEQKWGGVSTSPYSVSIS